jgi:hypothetical protein
MFEASNSRFCGRLSDNEVKNVKRSQFEIENILRNNFCDKSVTAGSLIEKDCRSHQFSFDEISIEEKLPKKFSVAVQSDGRIAPSDPSLKHKFWIKNIRVADDIPAANIVLDMHEDKIELKVIKTVNSTDELLLWFSEEILNFMCIPFLSPANIQGNFTKQLCFLKYNKRN